MSNSIKKILFSSIITTVIFLLFLVGSMLTNKSFNKTTKIYKDVEIYQIDSETLQILENISIDINTSNLQHLTLPLSIYNSGNINIFDTTVTVNNNQVLTSTEEFKNTNHNIVYSHLNSSMDIHLSTKNNMTFETGRNVITISYKCNINDVITNYNNIAVLKIARNKFNTYNNLNIALTLPTTSSSFSVASNKATVENISNNTYTVNLTKVTETNKFYYVSFAFDNNIFLNGNYVNENYDISKETNIFANEEKINTIHFYFISASTVIVFISITFITKKVRYKKNYVRDLKNVISPIFAETLIDGKVDSKEIIMTCIVDLICRGNIQSIDNDKFRLISKENLFDYEEQIINMIFGTKSTISFNEINDIFIKSTTRTNTFVMQFKQIKEKIANKLFEFGIYSKKGEKILEVLRTFITLIYVNICLLMINLQEAIIKDLTGIIIANILALLIIIAIKQYIKKKKLIYNKKPETEFTFILLLIELTLLCIVSHPELGCITLLTIILNIVNMVKANSHVLTKKGKEEYKKVQGLKSYIIDFSIINEKDVDSAIIWDKYLAYAVAFSIPNKITSKFKSSLMTANIILQNIDNLHKK